MKIMIRSEDDNLRNMEERCGDSTESVFSSPDREKSDESGRRQEENLMASPSSAPKITEPEVEDGKDRRNEGWDQTPEDHSLMDADRDFPLDASISVPIGDSSCAEAGDPFLLDDPGAQTVPNTDDLRPASDRTEAEGRASPQTRLPCGENIYHSVLHQLLQQQKHKVGRKHKKKTLMKMAKLLVIAKGWDRRENQRLSPEEESNLKEEILTSISSKRASEAGRIQSKPENPETDGNLPQPSDLHPSSDPASNQQSESTETCSVGEETKVSPQSRKQEPKRRRRAAEAGRKEEPPDGAPGCLELSQNKEGQGLTDPGLSFKAEMFRRQSVSSVGKQRRKRNAVIHLQAAESGWTDKPTSPVAEISAQKIQTQEVMKQPEEDRNPAAELFPGYRPLQGLHQTDTQEKGSQPDKIPKPRRRNPQKRRVRTKTPLSRAPDPFPAAQTPEVQNEAAKKSNMQDKRGKHTKTSQSLMEGTFSQEQEKDPIQCWEKPKGRGRKKKATLSSKTEPVWEAAAKQVDSPPTDVRSANPASENQHSRRRKLKRKRGGSSPSAEGTNAGSAAGGEEGFLSPVFGPSDTSESRKEDGPVLSNIDETEDGLKRRNIRRSCTLGNNVPSGTEEWLIRYLKGSRRKASSKSIKEEGHLEDEPQMMDENGTETKQRKKSGKKLSASSAAAAVPGKEKRRRRKTKQEPLDAGGPSFLSLPASASGLNPREEETIRKEQEKGQKVEGASVGPTGATPESSEPTWMSQMQAEVAKGDSLGGNSETAAPTKKKRGPKQKQVSKKWAKTEKTSDLSPSGGRKMEDGASYQDGSSWTEAGSPTGTTMESSEPTWMNPMQAEVTKIDSLKGNSKVAPTKSRRGPKRKRISKKGAKILESDGKHPDEGETGRTSDFSPGGGREMEDGASYQDGSSWTEASGPTGATPEPLETNRTNLLPVISQEIQDEFQGVNSEVKTMRRKKGRKRRQVIKKYKKTEPGFLESDGKHPDEGETEQTSDFSPNGGREMEDGSSYQDGSSWMDAGGPNKATIESCEPTWMNPMQAEVAKIDSMEGNSETTATKSRRGPKRKQVSKKRPKILESDGKHPDEGETGRTSDFSPGGGREMEDGASYQDGSCWTDPGGPTGATPESSETSRTDLLQIKETSEEFLGVKTARRKVGRKRRRMLKKVLKTGAQILESDQQPPGGHPEAPEDGRTSNVFMIQGDEGASCLLDAEADKEPKSLSPQEKSTEIKAETRSGLEREGKMNLLQTEGVTDQKLDSVEVYSWVRAPKRQRGRKRRRTLKSSASAGHENPTSCEDAGAKEDGEIRPASGIRRGRKAKIPIIRKEDGASFSLEKEADEDPQRETLFQDSVSSAAPRKARKRRRRSKTHWTGNKRAKKPQVRSFWDETSNIQHGDQKNLMIIPHGLEIPPDQNERKKSLRCSFCFRSFRHISAFTLHKRLHTGRKPFTCGVCGHSFSKLPQLKLHSRLHGEPPADRCPCCQETFKHKTELICHLKVHMDEVERLQTEQRGSRRSRSSVEQAKTFRCAVCSKEFTAKLTYEKHRRLHGKKPQNCRKTFRDASKIHGFLVSQQGDSSILTPVFFRCPVCEQIHRHWCHYVLHLQSHTSGRSDCCDTCKQEYSQAAGARRHCQVCCRASGQEEACGGSLMDIWKEEGGSGREHQLNSAGEQEGQKPELPEQVFNWSRFIPPPSLTGSSPSLVGDSDLDVLSLSSGFSSESDSASGQVSRLHPEPPRVSRRSWCRSCGGASSYWKTRGQVWRLGQRFRCRRCELEFRFLGSFMDHLQEHEPQMQHACPSCSSTFSDAAKLKSHMSSRHKEPDSLKCSTCGKLFSAVRKLQRHKLLHKGAGSHVCLPCCRSFSCHSALKAHLETHQRRLSVPKPARVEEPFLFPYHCRKCSATFSSADLLQAHQVFHFIAGRPPENPLETTLSSIPDIQRVIAPLSGLKRRLPVSYRKDLFRYPNPDRLYVVPAVSSEPPSVVSEAEDSSHGELTSAELQLQLLVKSLIPEKRLSDSSDSESEQTTPYSCAICTKTFPDVQNLHEHYRNHARGM